MSSSEQSPHGRTNDGDPDDGSADVSPQRRSFDKALEATAFLIRDAGSEPMRVESVRASVRVLCVFARQEGIAPEHLLVELKNAIHATGALDSVPADKRDAVRSDVVQFAINAYYGGGQRPPA
ncbi:MAG: hypothetical protein ACREBE_15535 [bacterium]